MGLCMSVCTDSSCAGLEREDSSTVQNLWRDSLCCFVFMSFINMYVSVIPINISSLGVNLQSNWTKSCHVDLELYRNCKCVKLPTGVPKY